MAACLSVRQSPWKLPHALLQETSESNDLTVNSYASKCRFDAGHYSEPLALMNLLWDFGKFSSQKRARWCRQNCVQESRIHRLQTTCRALQQRVADHCKVERDSLLIDKPPREMTSSKLTVLRVLQVWIFTNLSSNVSQQNFERVYQIRNWL